MTPCVIFFKEKPPTPPSHAANTEKMTFKEAFSSTMKNKDFILLLIGFGFSLGNINCLSTVINFYLDQFGFSSVREDGFRYFIF